MPALFSLPPAAAAARLRPGAGAMRPEERRRGGVPALMLLPLFRAPFWATPISTCSAVNRCVPSYSEGSRVARCATPSEGSPPGQRRPPPVAPGTVACRSSLTTKRYDPRTPAHTAPEVPRTDHDSRATVAHLGGALLARALLQKPPRTQVTTADLEAQLHTWAARCAKPSEDSVSPTSEASGATLHTSSTLPLPQSASCSAAVSLLFRKGTCAEPACTHSRQVSESALLSCRESVLRCFPARTLRAGQAGRDAASLL